MPGNLKPPAYYFLPISGIGCDEPGPGTAGVVGSPGRIGAGVIVSGLVVGVGGADLSRSQADNDSEARTMQVQSVNRVMGTSKLSGMNGNINSFTAPVAIMSVDCANECR